MQFRIAVTQTPALHGAYFPGLQALKKADRSRIRCRNASSLKGSVNLDQTLEDSHPNAPRWDYGIGVTATPEIDHVIWVEVHPASSHHIQEVLEKHRWLKEWLAASAPLLKGMDAKFVWIASGRVAMPPDSRQRKTIALKGIQFAGKRLDV
jgi:hypothetical protein